MKRKHSMTRDAGRGALRFFNAHGDSIGRPLAIVRARIEADVAAIDAFQLEQGSAIDSARGETSVQENVRRDIYIRFLQPIRVVANSALRDTAEFPSLQVRSRVPRDGDFVTKVITLANAAEKHEAVFLAQGMQVDFLAQLDAALGDLLKSCERRGRLHGRRSAATAGLKAAEKSLRDNLVVATSQVKRIVARQADVLAEWMASSKIHHAPVEPMRSVGIHLIGAAAAQAARLHASWALESTQFEAPSLTSVDSPAVAALPPNATG